MTSIFFALKAACHTTTQNAGAAALSELGLHGAQAQALLLLDQHGAMRLSDLARATQTGKPATSTLALRLTARGLVTRTPDPEDARAETLALTSEGRAAAQAMRGLVVRFEAALTEGFSDAERATILPFLTRTATLERL